MEAALLELIREISESKKTSGHFPTFVLRQEINQAVTDTLNKLYAEGKLNAGKTINDKWMEVKEN